MWSWNRLQKRESITCRFPQLPGKRPHLAPSPTWPPSVSAHSVTGPLSSPFLCHLLLAVSFRACSRCPPRQFLMTYMLLGATKCCPRSDYGSWLLYCVLGSTSSRSSTWTLQLTSTEQPCRGDWASGCICLFSPRLCLLQMPGAADASLLTSAHTYHLHSFHPCWSA